jgi:hypothetical protein
MSTSRLTLHRRPLIVMGAAATLAAGTFAATNIAGAASGPSAVDYAQCTNGAPTTTPPAGCNSWINGILNANNSQYHEDQVTPQRLTVQVTDAGAAGDSHTHSVQLTYLDRKGGVHAYDYLATIPAGALADRCLGLPGIAGVCPSATLTGSEPITPDDTVVPPWTTGANGKTSSRESADTLTVFGADFAGAPAMQAPQHTNAAGTGDDYAITTISFTTHGPGVHNVQLLFGGHLAAGTQAHAWGANLGASAISGGPYHIKWSQADGASVGNRDNQIMSGAILPIVPVNTQISTTPHTDTTVTTDHYDVATLTDVSLVSPPASETVTFDLYGPFTTADPPSSTVNSGAGNCTDPVSGSGGNEVTTVTGTVSSASPWTATSSTVHMSAATPGVYQWVAHYAGDAYNNPIDGTCGDPGEQFTIKASPTGSSAQTVSDTVTLSGQFVPPAGSLGGSVDFELYTDSSCATPPVYSNSSATITNGVASSGNFAPSTLATPPTGFTNYYWKVTYSGDDYNNATTLESCGLERVSILDDPS